MTTWLTLSNLKDLVAILTAPATIFFGYLGLRAWKRQLKGKDKYDASKRLLKSVLKLRDAVKVVRGNWMDSGEQFSAIKTHELKIDSNSPYQWTKEDRDMINRAVYATRWKSITDAFADFEVERLESEIIFSKKLQALLDKLVGHIIKLNSALDFVINNSEGAEEGFKRQMRHIVYKQNGEGENSDHFYIEFEATISEIQTYLKPHIRL